MNCSSLLDTRHFYWQIELLLCNRTSLDINEYQYALLILIWNHLHKFIIGYSICTWNFKSNTGLFNSTYTNRMFLWCIWALSFVCNIINVCTHKIQPLQQTLQIILDLVAQYHGYWCPGDANIQVNSRYIMLTMWYRYILAVNEAA